MQLRLGYLVLAAVALSLFWSLSRVSETPHSPAWSSVDPTAASEASRSDADAATEPGQCRGQVMERIATCRVYIDVSTCNAAGCATDTACNQDTRAGDCARQLRASTRGLGLYFCDMREPENGSDDLDTVIGRICAGE